MMHLVTIGGLERTIEIAKVLKVERKVGFCDNTLQNALRDMDLRACEKIPKPCLLQKNVQERLCFDLQRLDYRGLEEGGI